MDKKTLILSILALVGIFGVLLFQINIQGNTFLTGLGFVLGFICIIIACGIALIEF